MKKRKGGVLISQIHQVSARVFGRLMQQERLGSIPPAQGRILFALWKTEGMNMSELADKTLLDKSTLTGVIDRLEKNALVERVPSSADRRSIRIRRTDKLPDFEERFASVSQKMSTLYYKGFTEEEILQFEQMLERVLKNCLDADS